MFHNYSLMHKEPLIIVLIHRRANAALIIGPVISLLVSSVLLCEKLGY